jgi:cell division protein FtsB
MSAWMEQARTKVPSRLPRFAETAVERARLTVVPRRARAPRVPFMILVGALLLSGVVGLLLFNTSMQQASFRATALQAQADALHAQEQSLQMELDKLRDPQRVATRAKALGMVPMANPAFLRLSDGRVLGDPLPASPLDAERLTPLPAHRPAFLQLTPITKVLGAGSPDTGIDGVPSEGDGSRTGTTDQAR